MTKRKTEAQLRRELLRYCNAIDRKGWVANHDGNLSVRVNQDRIICTPTAMAKADVGDDDLVVLNGDGKKIAGRRRSFSELVLHLEVFDQRPHVAAVVHAHCPHATAWGVAGKPLPHPFLPEAVVSLGASIPTVPLTAPGPDSRKALAPWVRKCDAVIIAGNGVLSWGPDLETAYLRMELVEHIAAIATQAQLVGGVEQLPVTMVTELLEKRAKGGLMAPDEDCQRVNFAEASRKKVSASMPQIPEARVQAVTAEVMAAMGLKSSR